MYVSASIFTKNTSTFYILRLYGVNTKKNSWLGGRRFANIVSSFASYIVIVNNLCVMLHDEWSEIIH